jgi:hypothetical protein
VPSFANADKSRWGPGPWQDEPDKIVWVDILTGLDCMIHRNRLGALCGYVGVGPSHPDHGRAYYELDDIDVHGGLTYSDRCDPDATPEHGICHVPAEGRPADVWWFGFDCGHAFDIAPGMEADLREMRDRARELTSSIPDRVIDQAFSTDDLPRSVYRTVDYVRVEVESLAEQLSLRAQSPVTEP